MQRKKIRIIILIVSIILLLMFFLLQSIYRYERNIKTDTVLRMETISDSEAEPMELYICNHFGSVDKDTPYPNEKHKLIELSEEQKYAIQSRFIGKQLETWKRLWYRFDAVIMNGDELKYMLDLKNGVIFVENPTYAEELSPEGVEKENSSDMQIRKCIILPQYELEILKEALQGTGIKHTD